MRLKLDRKLAKVAVFIEMAVVGIMILALGNVIVAANWLEQDQKTIDWYHNQTNLKLLRYTHSYGEWNSYKENRQIDPIAR